MYPAKIQIRPHKQKILNYVKTQIRNNDIKIIKETKLKEGIDIYVDSSKFAFRLAKNFKKQLKGQTKVTRSLYKLDKQKGKKIYRLTVLLKLSEN
jgi:NMD protein affecting ribosome stability and mRNA decay